MLSASWYFSLLLRIFAFSKALSTWFVAVVVRLVMPKAASVRLVTAVASACHWLVAEAATEGSGLVAPVEVELVEPRVANDLIGQCRGREPAPGSSLPG